MPNVCVDGCGLTVASGNLSLDWAAVGATSGSTESAAFEMPLTQEGPDYIGPQGLVRLTYTNNTCQQRLLTYNAYIPYVSMDMPDNNAWTVALFWTHSFTAAPPSNTFNISTIALARMSRQAGETGQLLFSTPIPGREVNVVVNAGQTVYLMASAWKRLIQINAEDGRIYVPTVTLTYRSWPRAT